MSSREHYIKVPDLLAYLKKENKINSEEHQGQYMQGAGDQLRGIVGAIVLRDIPKHSINKDTFIKRSTIVKILRALPAYDHYPHGMEQKPDADQYLERDPVLEAVLYYQEKASNMEDDDNET